MRKSTFVLAVLLLAAIAWIGLQGNSPRAADAAKPAAQKFEYMQTDWQDAEKELNNLGRNGWEVCGVIPNQIQWQSVVIYKRPAQAISRP
jgi:hypothetical protein